MPQPTLLFHHEYSGMDWVNGSLTKFDKHVIGHGIGVSWKWNDRPTWDPVSKKYRWYWKVTPNVSEGDQVISISDGQNLRVITVQEVPHFSRWKYSPTVEKTDSEVTHLCNKRLDDQPDTRTELDVWLSS